MDGEHKTSRAPFVGRVAEVKEETMEDYGGGFRPFDADEHDRFVAALEEYGHQSSGQEWKMIAQAVRRSELEVKLHAQTYLLNLQKEKCTENVCADNIDSTEVTWTFKEDVTFEDWLFKTEEGDPARWDKIAGKIKTKTPEQVRRRYELLIKDISKIEQGQHVRLSLGLC